MKPEMQYAMNRNRAEFVALSTGMPYPRSVDKAAEKEWDHILHPEVKESAPAEDKQIMPAENKRLKRKPRDKGKKRRRK